MGNQRIRIRPPGKNRNADYSPRLHLDRVWQLDGTSSSTLDCQGFSVSGNIWRGPPAASNPERYGALQPGVVRPVDFAYAACPPGCERMVKRPMLWPVKSSGTGKGPTRSEGVAIAVTSSNPAPNHGVIVLRREMRHNSDSSYFLRSPPPRQSSKEAWVNQSGDAAPPRWSWVAVLPRCQRRA